jgi:site-specific DNA-methyltransferase (adenine-specific)
MGGQPKPARAQPKRAKPTATSNFGVGKRENHDASGFYRRFEPPDLALQDDEVAPPCVIANPVIQGDSRHMDVLDNASVALVVTSPPYFAGKQYEEELSSEGVPSSYGEYLGLLEEVFLECKRVLEPGGRIAVNVANLGRKPYRSLSADVTTILQDRLGLLLRGEVIWRKSAGASGNCAWGSYRGAANPVLRDLTERVVIASKGRFDRARKPPKRATGGLPHKSTLTADEFMAATLDVWDIPPESATRVRHPAPFPVELPERLIHLYTYRDDLVLDPFMGSGSALVAAARTGRRYIGYELDPAYVDIARRRVAEEGILQNAPPPADGIGVVDAARHVLAAAGFTVTATAHKVRGTGLTVDLVAEDADGDVWYIDITGGLTVPRTGLTRIDEAWQAVGRSHVMAARGLKPILQLTSHAPLRTTDAARALRAAGPSVIFDVIQLGCPDGFDRLTRYAKGGQRHLPHTGFWMAKDLQPRA